MTNVIGYTQAGANATFLPLGGGTATGEIVVPDLKVAGLTGAIAGGRIVGFTTGGPPTSGSFAARDVVIDPVNGAMFVCTAAGSPGVWIQLVGGGQQLGLVATTSLFNVGAVGVAATDVPSLSINVPATTRPFDLIFSGYSAMVTGTAANGSVNGVIALITDSSNNILAAASASAMASGVSATWEGNHTTVASLAANQSGATYKVRARMLSALAANWTSANLIPFAGFGPMTFEAVSR